MPLLDRADLVAGLRAGLEAARRVPGRVVLVSGEAGAGKTALVRAALPGAVWGFCEPLATPRPLGPFRDIVARLEPDAPVSRSALALADRVLRRLQDPGPAIVVEDAHWIDTSSAEVLRYLGRRIARTPALLVVIRRSEALADSALTVTLGELAATVDRLDVPPLTRREVAQLIDGRELDAAEVMRLTKGNAFLVGQLLVAPSGQTATTLRDSLAARLARLTTPGRDLVHRLSVVAGRIPAELIESDWPAVDELVAAGLLTVVADDIEFRHELVRVAIEESLPPGRRRALHEQVLERLTSAGLAESVLIAHHARLARRTDIALPAEIAAAERSASLGSHREATAHYRRAIEDATRIASPSHRVGLLVRLAEEEALIARTDDALAAATRAFALTGTIDDPLLRSRAARALSRLEPAEDVSLELAGLALDLSAPGGPSIELAAAWANLAGNRMLARDLQVAIGQARTAIGLAHEVGDVPSEVAANNALGSAVLLAGDVDGQIPLRRAIHLAASHGMDSAVGLAYGNLVSASGEGRLYELSATASREALRYFTARDLDGMANYTRAWTARCLFEQGRWTEAAEEVAALTAMAGGVNPITGLILYYLSARLHHRRGERAESPALAQAQAIADATGALQRLAPVAATRAEGAWLSGRAADVDALSRTYALALARENPWTIGELGFWLWRSGRLPGLPGSAAEPYRRHVAGEFRSAAQAWKELGCPYEAADALADSAVEADLREALAIFTELGATPGRQRTARRLRELGVRSVPRGPRAATTGNRHGLTAREAEIMTEVRAGRTDQEIAHGLHLSVRTVEHHVAAIRRKTGASSRRDLPAE